MRILICNDDGVFAPGIQILANHLAEIGHAVFVGAPDRERSTTGHCLTLHKPLRALDARYLFNSLVKEAWQINGTPCDSAKLAMRMLVGIEQIDMVVSGINRGPNLGTDVIYSGTVSAAMEGAIAGFPSIAVSMASFDDIHYETGAYFVGSLIEQIQTHGLAKHTVMNVNVPALPVEAVKGVKITKLGLHRFRDIFEKRVDLRQHDYYWQTGVVEDREQEDDTDVLSVAHGYIAVTPLHYDMTRYGLMDGLKQWQLELPASIA